MSTPCLIAAVSIFLGLQGPDLCVPREAKPDSAFQYAAALIDSFSYAKSAMSKKDIGLQEFEKNQDDPVRALSDLMFGIKSAERDYGCAATWVAGYLNSRNQEIAASARPASTVYRALVELDKRVVQVNKEVLTRTRDEGALAEEIADVRVGLNERWKDLVFVAALATHALVKVPDASDSRPPSLQITGEQRKTLMQKLEKEFGASIKGGMKAGQPALMWKSIDDPASRPR